MLLDMKLNLFCYIKTMFKELSKPAYLGNDQNQSVLSTFRKNRVCDVAMLWL